MFGGLEASSQAQLKDSPEQFVFGYRKHDRDLASKATQCYDEWYKSPVVTIVFTLLDYIKKKRGNIHLQGSNFFLTRKRAISFSIPLYKTLTNTPHNTEVLGNEEMISRLKVKRPRKR